MSKPDSQILECPKCMGELRTIPIQDEGNPLFYADQCFACSGLWLDAGEIMKTLKMKAPEKQESRAKLLGEWRDVVFDLKKSRCPHCKTEMARIPAKSGIPFAIDKCPSCSGVWLDGGEIRFFLKGRPLEKLGAFLVFQAKDFLAKQPLSEAVKNPKKK